MMPQSFSQIFVHIIFSTKNRMPMIDKEIQPRVFSYIATIARNDDCSSVLVGGIEDHVHILVNLSKKRVPVDIVAKIKKESSKFIKTLGNTYSDFYWQNGYGMFSVSPASCQDVRRYVETQSAHHKKMSFQEEFLAYLKKYEIEYDERYIWD
jgi:putative transposase